MYLHFPGNIPPAVFLFAMLLVLAFLLRRRRKLSGEPRRPKLRFFSTTLGNALQKVHVFVDPGVRYVIAERLDEQAEEGEEGDLMDPVKHLERQLRRIRRGEQLDPLTIRIKDKK
jgi:uncharacterized protein (TIGR03382 family)